MEVSSVQRVHMIQSNVSGALRLIGLLFFFSVGMTVHAQAQAANQPPTISGTPASWVYVGSQYYFRAQGYDREGATLRYSIQNRPSWATFSTSTGELSGTPTVLGQWNRHPHHGQRWLELELGAAVLDPCRPARQRCARHLGDACDVGRCGRGVSLRADGQRRERVVG